MFGEYKNWLVELDDDGIVLLTINREEYKNSLDTQTIAELDEILEQVQADDAVKAVVITGAGRVFGIGAHIPEILAGKDKAQSKELSASGQKIFTRLERLGKPSAAAINGLFCLGGSFELALCCTFRVASKRARLGLPEVTLGVIPGYGGTQRLPKFLGIARAKEMILTGEPIRAERAFELGLLNELCEAGAEIDAAKKLLKKVLKNAPTAIAKASLAIDKSFELPIEKGLDAEATLFSEVRMTKDAEEGLKSNLENRKPNFTGK